MRGRVSGALSVVCVGLQTYRLLVELKWVIFFSPSKDGRQEEVKKGEKEREPGPVFGPVPGRNRNRFLGAACC